jgi:exonuclease SbcC
MIPEKLTLSGFLSYQQQVEIDFISFDLACISGDNGSGKSSLLDAITWVLFGQARTRDDAVINLQVDSRTAEVSLIFSYEGNRYRVQRAKTEGKTTVLEFHIQGTEGEWKVLTERTMRATEALISEILRLDYETFVNASFFLQGKADQFTQQRPADRKRILSSILGLEVWEVYRQEAAKQRREIEKEITELDGRLQEILAELAEEDQRKTRLAEIQTNMDTITTALEAQTALVDQLRQQAALIEERRQLVDTLKAQAATTEAEIAALEQRLDDREQEKQSFQDLMDREQEIEATYISWQKSKDDLAAWNETAERFNEHEKRRQEPRNKIENERTRLETELVGLKKQADEIDTRAGQKDTLDQTLKSAQQTVSQLEKALQERQELEEQFQSVLQQQAEAKAENPRLKAEMDELKQRIEQLTSTDGADCPLCGQPLSPEDRKRLINELNEEGTLRGDRYRANQDLLQSITAQVEEITLGLKAYQGTEEKLREAIRQADQTEDQIKSIESAVEEWQKTGQTRRDELISRLEQVDYAADARQALAEIDEELKEIGYDAAAHDAVRKQEQDLRFAEDEQRKLENARATLKPLEREIKEIGDQIERTMDTLKKQLDDVGQAAVQLAAEGDAPDLNAAEQEMLNLKERENVERMNLGSARQKVANLEIQKERQKEIEAERETLSRRVGEYKVLERAFGKNGVPAMLIEQSLPQIETKANEILDRLSGGRMNIKFITQQEYKDTSREDLRETLEIQISDLNGPRGYEMFSGGEAFRINFAIRLALSEVLAQRAGARLQTLVIDEGFGSQDEIGRQRLVEAINVVKADFKKVLVITHIESLKEAFPTRLEVTKGPQGSSVDLI